MIGAFVEVLDDDVARVVHDIGVVAGAALHSIGVQAAVEHVIAGIPANDVVAGFA